MQDPPSAADDDPPPPPPTIELQTPARWLRWKPYVLAIAVAVLAAASFVAVHALVEEVRYDELTAAIRATPIGVLATALFFTLLSYVALMGYDASGLRYVGAKVPAKIVALTSFSAYALGNTIGLGPLTGGAVRYRVYGAAGVEPGAIARLIVFITIGFGCGVGFVGAVGLLLEGTRVASLVGAPAWLLHGIGALVLAALLGLVGWIATGGSGLRRLRIEVPSARIAAGQLLFSMLDIAAAAAALWILLPADTISYPAFLAVYAVAIAVGIASHVPGGLGVFEAVILLAVGGQAPLEQVTAALILYRVIYYALPLMAATAMLAGFEARRVLGGPLSVVGSVLLKAANRLMPSFLGALTLFVGVVLLISGSVPATVDSLLFLSDAIPLPIVEASHFLASISGLALLFVARGLMHRLDAAWWACCLLAAANFALAFAKGIAVLEMLLLGFLLAVLIAGRKGFTRRASLFEQVLSTGWLVAVGIVVAATVWILFFAHREVQYAHELWWQFEFDAEAPRGLRAALAVALLAMVAALWHLMRPFPGDPSAPNDADLAKAMAILRKQPFADANLVMMRDKSLLFSASGESFIMYGKHGRTWIALFDPIGRRDEWPELVWQFVETANAHGGRAVFYEVRADTLPLYLDTGMHAYKLGEEAKVDLESFDLKGGSRASIRNAKSRAEKEGLTVEVVRAQDLAPYLPTVRTISDAWIAEHRVREKRFSLGAFDETYIAHQSVALVRRHGTPIAFASLMDTDTREELTIDLMRHVPDAPRYTMEFLFTWLMLWARDNGYKQFVLGMAPLSGLERHRLAPLWHRVGRLVWSHGNMFYNFQGLRGFKDKFKPQWEPRYLAAPGGLNPLLAIADIAALTSGGIKGIVTK